MKAEGTPEHEWLMHLLGSWTTETHCIMDAEGTEASFEGRETFRALGDVWVVGDQEMGPAEAPDITSVITLGYDTARSRYVGSWVGSPMNYLVTYEGSRDGGVLTLDAEAPDIADPNKTARYQDILEIVSDNERIFRSQMEQPDGSWKQFMRAVCTRAEP